MKVHVLDPAAAAGVPLTSPLPVDPMLVPNGWRRFGGTAEYIIFYGLLGLGIAMPLLGVVYAYIFR